MMLGLIQDLKDRDDINLKNARYDSVKENEDFEWACKQEGMDIQ